MLGIFSNLLTFQLNVFLEMVMMRYFMDTHIRIQWHFQHRSSYRTVIYHFEIVWLLKEKNLNLIGSILGNVMTILQTLDLFNIL